jgi:hypothetical protein
MYTTVVMMVIPLAVLPEITTSYKEHDDICSAINAKSSDPDSHYKMFDR